MKTTLGKITWAKFGYGGYDDAQFGFSFRFDTQAGSFHEFWGCFPNPMPLTHAPLLDQAEIKKGLTAHLGERCYQVLDLMNAARVTDFFELVGKPVQVTYHDDGRFESFRILDEVL